VVKGIYFKNVNSRDIKSRDEKNKKKDMNKIKIKIKLSKILSLSFIISLIKWNLKKLFYITKNCLSK
jgi:hypothetical protein